MSIKESDTCQTLLEKFSDDEYKDDGEENGSRSSDEDDDYLNEDTGSIPVTKN